MRAEGWEPLLRAHIKSHEGLPFAWGENDCSLFVARWADIILGTTHTDEWEGLYNTEQGAQAIMDSRGYTQASEIVTEHLNIIHVKQAKRGDIVMIDGGCLGICDGRKSWFFVEGSGLTALLTTKCLQAWRL